MHKNPCSRGWLQLGWNLAVFLTLPEEYGDSRQLGKEAEPLLWELFGNSISLQGLLTATLTQGARGGCAQGLLLCNPQQLEAQGHFGMSILEVLSCPPVCGNGTSCGGKCKFAALASLSCVSQRSLCEILVALALFCLLAPRALPQDLHFMAV